MSSEPWGSDDLCGRCRERKEMTESISLIAIHHSLESYCLIPRLLPIYCLMHVALSVLCFAVFFDPSYAVKIASLLELPLSAEL